MGLFMIADLPVPDNLSTWPMHEAPPTDLAALSHTSPSLSFPVVLENISEAELFNDSGLDQVLSQVSLPSPVNNQTEHVGADEDDGNYSISSPATTDLPKPYMSTNNTEAATKTTSDVLKAMHAETTHFIESKQNKNTLRSIDCSKNKFQNFIVSKGINSDMLNLSNDELDQLLGAWVLDMKKNDGTDYEPTTVTANVNRLARYFSDKKAVDIHDKVKFPILQRVLEAKKKTLKQSGLGNTPHRAEILEESDEEKLWESGALGLHSPESLLHTVWFHTTKLLGFRGSNEARQIRLKDFTIVKNESEEKIDYIEWNERETKTRHGDENQSSRSFAPKMWPNLEDPNKCPVVAFLKYQSKRPKDMLDPESPFYLTINHNAKSSENWYKNCPMGKNCIGSIMKKMSTKANLKGKFTNHSLRRTTCTMLVRAGIPLTTVAQLTGHKNIGSFLRYTTASKRQQQEILQILQGKRVLTPSKSSSSNQSWNHKHQCEQVERLGLTCSSRH